MTQMIKPLHKIIMMTELLGCNGHAAAYGHLILLVLWSGVHGDASLAHGQVG